MMYELLSPAGDPECLQAAIDYGANAVYLGGKSFGMRAGAKNFDGDSLEKALRTAHDSGVRVYLTCNTVPTNDEAEQFPEYIRYADKIGIDAVIVADIGVMAMVKRCAPNMEIHMSTQVGIMNYETANELYRMGAKRIVLAREVDLDNIKRIRDRIPADMEIEAFVHGAMCISFSGRCLLSQYLTGRDANRGQCAQPCRWSYSLVEERRPGEYYNITEDERGTYILNAKDMCMLPYLREMMNAGVNSFKIEGRAKSAYYVAVTANAYRAGLDAAIRGEDSPDWALGEVYKVSHRPYCSGFYFGTQPEMQFNKNSGYIRECDFVGIVDGYSDGMYDITQRNYFTTSDELEVLTPRGTFHKLKIDRMLDSNGIETNIANKAVEKLRIGCESECVFPPHSIIRRPCIKEDNA